MINENKTKTIYNTNFLEALEQYDLVTLTKAMLKIFSKYHLVTPQDQARILAKAQSEVRYKDESDKKWLVDLGTIYLTPSSEGWQFALQFNLKIKSLILQIGMSGGNSNPNYDIHTYDFKPIRADKYTYGELFHELGKNLKQYAEGISKLDKGEIDSKEFRIKYRKIFVDKVREDYDFREKKKVLFATIPAQIEKITLFLRCYVSVRNDEYIVYLSGENALKSNVDYMNNAGVYFLYDALLCNDITTVFKKNLVIKSVDRIFDIMKRNNFHCRRVEVRSDKIEMTFNTYSSLEKLKRDIITKQEALQISSFEEMYNFWKIEIRTQLDDLLKQYTDTIKYKTLSEIIREFVRRVFN